MKKVLVIGSINMDYTIYLDRFPLKGETILGNEKFVQPGGKGLNQAAAIKKSNLVDVNFVGAIGEDIEGKEITKVLNELDLSKNIIKYHNVGTGNAIISVEKSGENEIIILSGANKAMKFEDIPINLLKECDILLLQNEIDESLNEKLINECFKLNKTIIYNPAPFRNINKNLLSKIDYIIPNKNELFQLTNEENYIKGANILLDLGVKNIIVTLGKDGSYFVNKNESFHCDSYLVKPIDTVAAGDTFIGYFVASLASNLDLKTSLKIASKASSITITRKGSVVSIPYGYEFLNEFIKK